MADEFDDFHMELCTCMMSDLKDMTAQQTGHAVTGRTSHSFEDYKALLMM